jgi:hypothetical protein
LAPHEYRLTERLGAPAPRRRLAWALLASVVAHAVLLLVWRVEVRAGAEQDAAPRVFVLVPDATARHEAVDLPALGPPRARGGGRPPAGAVATVAPLFRGPTEARRAPPGPPAVRPGGPGAVADTGGGAADAGRIGPEYGEGKVWVEPYPETPSELANRIRRAHGDLVDSAVTAIVQAYLDSIASEPGAQFAEMPSWVTDIGGRKFGLDSRYIYVAGLKIPAAVLALLPFPQGNVDQALANQRLQDLRADLFQAAQRAENAEEFKRAIREIRERKEAEEEFERNRRTRPGEESPDEARRY